MPSFWRLIESPPSDIFSHMDLDRQLFEEFLQDPKGPPILRLYRVSEPDVSVGRLWRSSLRGSAKVRWRRRSNLSKWGLLRSLRSLAMTTNVCIRPTGGGLVRHGNDLIYSVIARRDSFPTFHQVRTSYLSFHEAVQGAFQKLGIETRLFRCDDSQARANAKRGPSIDDCFHRPVPTDVAIGTRKIAGGAQWRRGEAFLHQGSIQLPEGVSFEGLKEALVEAFERQFGMVWDKIVEKV